MNARIVVDPVTRIEGHLRIEAQMNGNQIEQAYSSGTMVRGIEIILRDRDPRDAWAFAQRICGVCTLVHGIASIRSVENAIGAKVPPNAQLIRNLMIGAQYIHDHVMHFYHLHALDWVDVVSALKADPAATAALAQSLSSYPRSSTGYFKDVQKKVADFVAAGQLGIFAKAYWGHPGVQAAAGSQPDGGRALPGCARMATRRRSPARDLRWQESAPELRRRRRAVPDRPEFRLGDQQQAPEPGSGNHQQDEGVRRAGLRTGHASRSPVSTRTGLRAARGSATSCASATCRQPAWTIRIRSCSRAASSSIAT